MTTSDSSVCRIASLLLFALVCGVASPALSQSSAEEGPTIESLGDSERSQLRELLGQAKEAYNAGRFEESVGYLREAHDILPKADFYYRIAVAWERAGKPVKAIASYRKFLEARPDSSKRRRIERTIATLRKRAKAKLVVESSPSGAEVTVRSEEGERTGTTPMELYVAEGRAEVRVEKVGFRPQTKTIDGVAGETKRIAVELDRAGTTEATGAAEEPAEAGADGDSESAASSSGEFPVVWTAISGALVVGTGALLVAERSAHGSLRDIRADRSAYTLEQEEQAVRQYNTLHAVTLGAGALTLGAIGVTIFKIVGDSEPTSAAGGDAARGARIRVGSGPTPLGAGVSVDF